MPYSTSPSKQQWWKNRHSSLHVVWAFYETYLDLLVIALNFERRELWMGVKKS